MKTESGFTITVRVDTSDARREVADFRLHALRVIEELRAAYASLGPDAVPGADSPGRPGRRV